MSVGARGTIGSYTDKRESLGNEELERASKIEVKDYPLENEVELRMKLKNLSPNAFKVLDDLFYSSLRLDIDELTEELGLELDEVKSCLSEIEPLKIFELEGNKIHVDKERRKFLEIEAARFHEDFRGDLGHLFALISKVAPESRISWYHIPRSASNIREAIREKYFDTPERFYDCLEDFVNEHPAWLPLFKELLLSEEDFIPKSRVCELLSLDEESFYKWSVLLEFNLVAYLNCRKKHGEWEEGISFWAHWCDYLRYLRNHGLTALKAKASLSVDSYALLEKFGTWLRALKVSELPVENVEGIWVCPGLDSRYLSLGLSLDLIEIVEGKEGTKAVPSSSIEEFLSQDLEEQAMVVYQAEPQYQSTSIHTKHVRGVEKELRRIVSKNLEDAWFSLDDFVEGCTYAFDESDKPHLIKKQGEWCYHLASYSQNEKDLIRTIIKDHMSLAGVCQVRDNLFRLTDLGRSLADRVGGIALVH